MQPAQVWSVTTALACDDEASASRSVVAAIVDQLLIQRLK